MADLISRAALAAISTDTIVHETVVCVPPLMEAQW